MRCLFDQFTGLLALIKTPELGDAPFGHDRGLLK
jgi:hypothetical protein